MNFYTKKQGLYQLLNGMEQSDKYWKSISLPISLSDGLLRLTKVDLECIGRNLRINGLSGLRKQELVEELREAVPHELEHAFQSMEQEQYNLLIKLTKKNGVMSADKLDATLLQYVRERGMAFTGTVDGKKIIALPLEIKEAFENTNDPSFQERVRTNTEWYRLTKGLLFYYGTLTQSQLMEFIELYTGEEVDVIAYMDLLIQKMPYCGFGPDKIGYSDFNVEDPNAVQQGHLMRNEVPYFPFTKKQLLNAAEPDYIERNESFLALASFLMRTYSIDKHEADGIAEECIYAIQNGQSMPGVMSLLEEQLEFSDRVMLEKLVDIVVQLVNNTKQWALKGYAPLELRAEQGSSAHNLVMSPQGVKTNVIPFPAKEQKIGRNDPCPCGSGKKYKKCCGN